MERNVVGAYALVSWPTPEGFKEHDGDLFRATVELDVGRHTCGCGNGPTRQDACRAAVRATLNQVGRLIRAEETVADGNEMFRLHDRREAAVELL
jgi:hypothetical protein